MATNDDQQDSPGVSVALNYPAQPSWQVSTQNPYTNTSQTSGGTETVAPGPQFTESLGKIDQALAGQRTAIAGEADVKRDIAGIEAAGAAKDASISQGIQDERQRNDEQLAPEVAKRMAQAQKDIAEFRAMDAPALFANSSKGANIAKAIALAAATIGDAMAARANALLGRANGPSAVAAIINNDIEAQKERLKNLADKMATSGKNVEEIRAYQDRLDKRLDARRVAMLEHAQTAMLAAAKGKGMSLVDAQKDKNFADLAAATEQAKAQLVNGMVVRTKSPETTTTNMGEQTTTINREPTVKAENPNGMNALRRERIAANIHEYQAAAKELKDGVITPEVLDKVQFNDTVLQNREGTHGDLALLSTLLGRTVDVIPKSRYDGLTPEQARAMQAIDTMLQHGSEMQPSTGVEVSHAWKAVNMPKAGTTQEEINSRIAHLKQAGEDYRRIIDPQNLGARADGGGGAPVRATSTPPARATLPGASGDQPFTVTGGRQPPASAAAGTVLKASPTGNAKADDPIVKKLLAYAEQHPGDPKNLENFKTLASMGVVVDLKKYAESGGKVIEGKVAPAEAPAVAPVRVPPPEMLAQAREIVAHPEKYDADDVKAAQNALDRAAKAKGSR